MIGWGGFLCQIQLVSKSPADILDVCTCLKWSLTAVTDIWSFSSLICINASFELQMKLSSHADFCFYNLNDFKLFDNYPLT